ncbi:TetR family transcriptional regulator [Nocardioides albertanoniae]|uniref:TetR family transcriptional regulator n=1 Tax=Nocardioides albertanoniae TaxID=1175486 RepID=A0A543AAZ5_9ACTN|nr:TetR/AcrR family transcriptional regulator [Nocardioides albertanoniae]TQL69781.1 TetR family transcriptional regulator [Nocardioides albertanoniae]
MSERRGGTKQRMLVSAVTLLRERGSRGVTIDAVLAHSGAPRGSVYHHFPGGREQLVDEAARFATDFISGMITDLAAEPTTALDRFIDLWAQMLVDTDYRAGCPVVGVAIAAESDSDLASDAFATWSGQLAEHYRADGLTESAATTLATSTIAAVEGAIILSRAERSTKPLDDVRRMLHAYHGALASGAESSS